MEKADLINKLSFFLVIFSFGGLSLPAQVLNVSKRITVTTASTRPQPKALSAAEKLLLAQQLLKPRRTNVTSLDSPIVLTAVNMSVSKVAWLTFLNPVEVSPYLGGVAVFSGKGPVNSGSSGSQDLPTGGVLANARESALDLVFKAPAAGDYLIDLTISAEKATTKLNLTSPGNIVISSTNLSGKPHLTFVTDAKQANAQISISLSGDGYWNFYSCEISRIK